MAKSKIYIKPSRRGTFTSAAKKRGKGVQEFAKQVVKNPGNYSPTMRKKAQFAVNSAKWNREDGGMVPKYGLGGDIFAGAATGAAAGAAVAPPFGAIAGTVIGGVAGLVSGKKKQKAKKEQEELMLKNQTRQRRLAELESDVNYQPVMKKGGEVSSHPSRREIKINPYQEYLGSKSKDISLKDLESFIHTESKRIKSIRNLLKNPNKWEKGLTEDKLKNRLDRTIKNINEAKDLISKKPKLRGKSVDVDAVSFACGGRVMRKYPLGGLIPYDDTMPIETEGGESGVEPDGDQFNIQGPSHAQGGVPMEAEVGTRIFSDKLTQPGTNATYSDLNKPIASKITKYQEIVDDPYSTKTAKRTAQRMLDRLTLEQDALFNEQQALNGNNTGQNQMVPKAQEGIQVEDWMLSPFETGPTVDPEDLALFEGNLEDKNIMPFGQRLMEGAEKFASQAAPITQAATAFAPALLNIGQGLFGEVEQEDPSLYSNVAGQAALARLRGRRYNIDPQIEATRRAFAGARRNLAARTRGEQLAGAGTLGAAQAQAESAIQAQKQNIEDQYLSEAAQMTAQLGAQESAIQQSVAARNAQARAARRNILRKGVEQAATATQFRQRQANLSEMDRRRLEILNQMFPNFGGLTEEDYTFKLKR